MLTPRLNRNLRPDAYRKIFKAHRRLHIPDILHLPSAHAILSELRDCQDWGRTIRVAGDQDVFIGMSDLQGMSAAERASLEDSLFDSNTGSIKYIFDKVKISSELSDGGLVSECMSSLHDFVNGKPFLDFMARVTGDDRVAFADVMATRYQPGHFATAHGDQIPGLKRLYAYVLNLTPQWRADWGGILMFHDEDGHIAEGYVPKFNALNIFAVPQTHSVSAVSRLAETSRHSITGWIHERD